MKTSILLIIKLALMSLVINAQEMPRLGDIWRSNINPQSKLYVYSYGFLNKVEIEIDNLSFNLGLDSANRIVFISSSEKLFKINGVSYVGMNFLSTSEKKKVTNIIGWGQFVKITDNWYIATDFGNLDKTSTIKFVFQYLEKK